MLRFRLLNVPVQVNPTFWVGSAILGSNLAQGKNSLVLLAIWVGCVFVSIMVHEFGHALAAACFGTQPSIELLPFGGVTRRSGRDLNRAESFLVTLAGPAAGLGLFALSYALARGSHHAAGPGASSFDEITARIVFDLALTFLLQINLYWSLFNLLPILPLDGGNLLRNVLGPRRLNVSFGIGVFFAGSLATLAAFSEQWYLALLLGYLTYGNLRGNARALPGDTTTGR